VVLDAFRSRGLSVGRLLVTFPLLALLAAAVVYGDPDSSSLAFILTAVVFVVVSAVRRFRTHDAWPVVNTGMLFVWGLALFLAGGDSRPYGLLLVVVGLVGAAIETYNYRHGTSYGRISRSG
jgi:FtsH-binding integral membrane protein